MLLTNSNQLNRRISKIPLVVPKARRALDFDRADGGGKIPTSLPKLRDYELRRVFPLWQKVVPESPTTGGDTRRGYSRSMTCTCVQRDSLASVDQFCSCANTTGEHKRQG